MIPSIAAIAYGIGTDGEGHVAQRGVGALAKKLTTSFGIDKLTPQQAKEAFSGTGAAKKYADIMGDFSSDIGKKCQDELMDSQLFVIRHLRILLALVRLVISSIK